MEAKLLRATVKPVSLIGSVAGICYGNMSESRRRVETCVKSGHLSVLEHASATWHISDVSRACTHQLVRHRLASYTQRSQRYCKEGMRAEWYVVPPSIADNGMAEAFEQDMNRAMSAYNAYIAEGVKPEDARFLLPEATKTQIVATMNARELFHFLDERLGRDDESCHAQWEIRELARAMMNALMEEEEWDELLAMRYLQ